MGNSSRRSFLLQTAGLVGVAMAGTAFDFPKRNSPLLSFSTLGCPDWSFQQIIRFAKKNKYDGIELRGIQRELYLPNCPEFSTPLRIRESRNMMEDKGLTCIGLGASTALHYSLSAERTKNIDEGKRFIDLAQELNCPNVRVFPNDIPKGKQKSEIMDLISTGLLELADYAKGTNVKVLLESHGAFVSSEDLLKIMKRAEHPHVGLIWDIVNMWVKTKESPAKAYEALKDYIVHTHIKDMNFVDDKIVYKLLGRGESPVFEAINTLDQAGYKGFYSFEWEKLWQPKLEEPEIAIADYSAVMRKHFLTNHR